MGKARRRIAAIALAVLCAPTTFLRSDVSWDPPSTIALEQIAQGSETGTPGWRVAGVWHYSAQSLLFGGFSALIALPDGRLRSFSDRGARFTFDQPDQSGAARGVTRQPLAAERVNDVPDIEAATRDPQTGTYWLAFENHHGVQRYTTGNMPSGVRDLDADALGWTANTGGEAMVRLDDGRFVIVPEGRRVGLIFAGDPIEAGDYKTFDYLPPIPGHAATAMAQLPDGRVLLLLRNLDWGAGGMPPFESKIAIGPAPVAGSDEPWAPTIALDLAGVVPRENYEGMAVRALADGRVAVWLISDDNLSLLQRSLLVKLVLDPAALE